MDEKYTAFLEHEIELLGGISALASTGADPGQIFSAIVDGAAELLVSANASLMLVNKNSASLTIAAAKDAQNEVVRAAEVPIGQGVAGWVAEHKQPLLLVDGSDDAGLVELSRRDKVKDALSVPVVWRDELLGVLNVSNKLEGTFNETDLVPLMIFADQSAAVINDGRTRQAVDDSYVSLISALAEVVDARDPYTYGHSKAIRDYALGIGNKLVLDKDTLKDLEIAALLHDIGKLGMADAILLKPGPLTRQERELMKTHPVLGAKILEPVAHFAPVVPIILHHHERYDGSGYPDGLKGEEIPLGARIVGIADAFDAMSSKRVYRPLLSTDEILEQLRRGRGRQFDPGILNIFVDAFEIDRRIYRAGETPAAERIHGSLNYYALAVKDSPSEVRATLDVIADIIESLMRATEKYAGPVVKENVTNRLNGFAIENRLDFVVHANRPDISILLPLHLVELMKRFEVYLDHLLTITAGSLGTRARALIVREARERLPANALRLFEQIRGERTLKEAV